MGQGTTGWGAGGARGAHEYRLKWRGLWKNPHKIRRKCLSCTKSLSYYVRDRGVCRASSSRRNNQYGCRLDQDCACSAPGRKAGNQQQDGCIVFDHAGGNRREGNQEERGVCSSRPGPSEEVCPQGAHWPQPPDRRPDQDPGQDRGEVLCWQGGEGRDRTAEKEVVSVVCEGRPIPGRPFLVVRERSSAAFDHGVRGRPW